MHEDTRADPDALLAAIQKEESQKKRGKLKVFLGMAAGAGKTYAMLEAAIKQKKEGANVVIGYVETHGRRDTEALAQQLPLLPRKSLPYRSVDLEEFDLDAALVRHPQLILVDELAHTNAPGSRHPKRYQDVIELVESGIDVYTTLNVQHVESRADTVKQITGSRMHETVPDSVLDRAEIELIDISPEDLLKRLDEGKVYMPERAVTAMMNFFREGNLKALREMALRLAAERVGQDVRDYMQVMQITGPWKTGHRLLVAVSPSPLSAQLIRWTRRLADSWNCPWIALYIELSRPLAEADQTRLTKNLNLARELGAEVITTSDEDVVRGIVRIAHQQNVTQIVVGKPAETGFINFFERRSFLARLVKQSGDIDVHIVRAEKAERAKPSPSVPSPREIEWREYGVSLGVVLAVAFLNAVLDRFVGYRALSLNFLFAVVLLGLFFGRGPVLFAATLSALVWNYWFLPPRHTLIIHSLEDAMMFAMYFVIAVVIGHLVTKLRLQEQAERRREERSTALYLLTRNLADASGLDEILKKLVDQIHEVFHADAAVSLAESSKRLAPSSHPASIYTLPEKESGIAAWVFQHRRAAGRFTDNLPASEALHLPLETAKEILGVLSVKLRGEAPPALDQRNLLDAFARQAALVIDRQQLQESAQRSRLHAESERLGKTLLDSISHEMRTPIAAISSAITSLAQAADDTLRKALLTELQTAAQRLNRLVANLLNATRVESGHLISKLEWHDPADLINIVVKGLERELSRHRVRLDFEPDLPLVRMDFSLMEQVFANLLLNAAHYTPPGTEIVVRVTADDSEVTFLVKDHGLGIPKESLERVFDKFYRVPGTPSGGTGLGLSIVKGFVEAQGGMVAASNGPEGGALFFVCMPRERQPEIPEEPRA